MSDIRAVTYEKAVAVTTSDTVADPAGPFAGLHATTAAGLAKVTTVNGDVVTLYLLLGTVLNVAVQRVWTSVTTATGIVGVQANPYRTPLNPGTGTVI